VARFEARKSYEFEQTRKDGVWRPICSAKQAFDVDYEYEIVGTAVPARTRALEPAGAGEEPM
jgi:hypothetical protein